MRKITKLISIVTVVALTLSALVSCGLFETILGPSIDSSSGVQNGGGQSNVSPNNKEDKNDPSNGDDNDDGEKEEISQKPEQTTEPADNISPEEEANMARYGYSPVVSNTMAAIYINTPDGSNSWATKYSKNDKTSGNIDYIDATISVKGCEEAYRMANVEAEVKVRGNATLNYEKKPIRIKFGEKNNILGLHNGEKYKNWVLLADYKDLSMCNNTAAFFLGNLIQDLLRNGMIAKHKRPPEMYSHSLVLCSL